MKNWPTLLLCSCCLAMVAFGAFGPEYTVVSERCEPREMPEPCSEEDCAAIARAECERFVGGDVQAMTYCKVNR